MKIIFSCIASFYLSVSFLSAHCQLPCGIYHDDLEFSRLSENVQTLGRALNEIKATTKGGPLENNQLIRSVILKDQVADQIAHTMSFYFLQQRLSPEQQNLPALLMSAYKILRSSAQIKAKIDEASLEDLKNHLAAFKKLYTESH